MGGGRKRGKGGEKERERERNLLIFSYLLPKFFNKVFEWRYDIRSNLKLYLTYKWKQNINTRGEIKTWMYSCSILQLLKLNYYWIFKLCGDQSKKSHIIRCMILMDSEGKPRVIQGKSFVTLSSEKNITWSGFLMNWRNKYNSDIYYAIFL